MSKTTPPSKKVILLGFPDAVKLKSKKYIIYIINLKIFKLDLRNIN